MKFLSLLPAVLAAIQTTQACIVIHSNLSKCESDASLIEGTSYTMDAEMYDNGQLVCSGEWTKRTASDDWYPIQCNNGYSLSISPNGRQATMRSPNGYTATMGTARQADRSIPGCGTTFGKEPKEVDAKVTEACFFDGFWNCNQFPGCSTCGQIGAGSCRTSPGS